MQFSTSFYTIINYLRQDSTVDQDIIEDLLETKKRVSDDFLFIDINEKDDYITFIPKKASNISLLESSDMVYKLINPVRVDRNHDIYRNYLSTLTEEQIDKIHVRCIFSKDDNYKIITRCKPNNHWDGNYDIIHMESLVDGSQFLNLQDLSKTPNMEPDFSKVGVKGSDMKVGRFLRKILPVSTTNKQIEDIVNAFKSQNTYINNLDKYFKVIEGDDIKVWYDEEKYAKNSGNLNGSCMRLKSCQDFFNIYTETENKVKMLILTNTSGELVCRALLWTLDDGNLYMDRIYGQDYNIRTFVKWGEENGYALFYNNGTEHLLDITLKVNMKDKFPYLDTFKYMVIEVDDVDGVEGLVYGKFFNRIDDNMRNKLQMYFTSIPNYSRFDNTDGTYYKKLQF